jgi:general secretion pathway protein G
MTPDYQSPKRPTLMDRLIRHGIQSLLIIIVLLILFAVFVPKYGHGPAKISATKFDLADLQSALAAFAADNARYPTTSEGLNALLENPGLPTWKGPYIKRLRNDPWGNPYRYTPPAAPPTLSSDGPDALPNTPDDIKNP